VVLLQFIGKGVGVCGCGSFSGANGTALARQPTHPQDPPPAPRPPGTDSPPPFDFGHWSGGGLGINHESRDQGRLDSLRQSRERVKDQ